MPVRPSSPRGLGWQRRHRTLQPADFLTLEAENWLPLICMHIVTRLDFGQGVWKGPCMLLPYDLEGSL